METLLLNLNIHGNFVSKFEYTWKNCDSFLTYVEIFGITQKKFMTKSEYTWKAFD